MDWHPIRSAEDLPDVDNTKCLITRPGYRGRRYVTQAMYDNAAECFYDTDGVGFDDVIAWMPMPAPYRPEKEESK